MKTEDQRNKIDDIDRQLVRLLNRRAKLAIEIGMLKQSSNLPIYDPDREAAVLRQVLLDNDGPLDAAAVLRIFRRIILESRRIETRKLLTRPSSERKSKEYSKL